MLVVESAGPVDARVAYTLLSAKSLSEPDSTLTRLIRRPRHTLGADVVVTATGRSTLGAGVQVVAGREDTDFNSFPARRVDPGDYVVARLYASHELGPHVSVRARVENLFDRRYEPVYGFPALGRSLTGSAAVRF